MMAATQLGKFVTFGQHQILASQIFYRSKLCLGVVNYMPVKPGHLMLIPKRKVERYVDMTPEEVTELFLSSQKVCKVVNQVWNATSLTMAVQDGPDSGQTVKHVHLHIIPRHAGDFARNDDVYAEIEKPRTKRTEEEMAQESEMLAKFFPDNDKYSLYPEDETEAK
eukprot:TRINITY_DN1444_c0_g4_i1.p1 TRINITY_DN1444_c0_g4~~TRINITY_DN1444_c0_g4_i1.p1  ORF type:complete len:166 (-),score=45.00 TRINITY_DN1444_c0_g4_i1:19-516(-)